ncbi:MAG TPA: DNA adenine methylase [Myxococcota bacterium]|nr:DNA adenine methylase [Myxococcota bacterium]
MIKYLGSKRVLLPRILATIERLPGSRTVLDLFSGTSRVGHALKRTGRLVLANDHNAYAYALARCYVQADRERVGRDAERLLAELARVSPAPGWFTETYCERARYFHPRNGARIEAMREWIARRELEPDLEAVLLVALMEAADRVDSTTGVQMAYLKRWAPRALSEIALRMPDVLAGAGRAYGLDALAAAERLEADVAYLDPPYNQHRYLGNYHVWESLVRWDHPEVYGVACKRVACRSYASDFNSKRRIGPALATLLERLRVRHLVVSFNDEGYLSRDELEALLSRRGHVEVVAVDGKRYVGSQIGIYNPRGERVGQPGRLRNTEYLFIVSEDVRAVRAAAAA